MSGGVRFQVPADLAEKLIADGTSVRSYTTRGPAISDAVQIALNVVNSGADIVTVATAAAAMPAFVRRLRDYLRRDSGEVSEGAFEIVLRSNGRETVIKLPLAASDEEAGRVLVAGAIGVRADTAR